MKHPERKQRRKVTITEERKERYSESPLGKLRDIWKKLPEERRDYWREQLKSSRPQKELIQEIREEFGIELKHETYVTRFRQFIKLQDELEDEALAVEADKEELRRQGLRGEQLREELIKRMKARALARGNFTLGAVAVKLDLQAEKVALDERKVKLQERKAKAEERAAAEQEEVKKSKGG